MNIEKYGHRIEQDWPGSEWADKEKTPILVEGHDCAIGELLSDEHFDVFVRYGYAKSLVEGGRDEEHMFWESFYDRMQERRIGISNRGKFDYLIASFEKRGFDPQFPIPVDPRYDILDGSHRLACSVALDIFPRVAIYKGSSHSYDRLWFLANGFSEEEIQMVDKTRESLFRRYKEYDRNSHVGIVWGMALEYWDDIIGLLKSRNLRRSFIIDFENKVEEFITESYIGDGMEDKRIKEKAKKLASSSSRSGFIVMEGTDEEIQILKKTVREEFSRFIEGYFFDCIIHFIDNKEVGHELLDKYNLKK